MKSLKLPILKSSATGALFALVFSPAFATAQPSYEVCLLGSLGGGETVPNGISDTGYVTGQSRKMNQAWGAFVWSSGGMFELGSLQDGEWAIGSDVNTSGEVAGYAEGFDVFSWTDTLGLVNITEDIDSACFSAGINNHGAILGDCVGSEASVFVWTHETGIIELTQASFPFTSASAINDAGQVAGWVRKSANAGSPTFPVRWENGSQISELQVPRRYEGGRTSGIAQDGSIAGWLNPLKGPDAVAAVWNADRILETIIPNPRNQKQASYARDINDRGTVLAETGDGEAFLYIDGASYMLDSLLADGSDLEIAEIAALNNSDQIIGHGTIDGEDFQGFLLHQQELFIRGDANGDQIVNIADFIYLISYLFRNGPEPTVLDSGDADDNGIVDLADAMRIVYYIFLGGQPPAEPSELGFDPTPTDCLF